MNTSMLNQFTYQTILEEGKNLKIPETKKRALIREYLQSKIIAYLYKKPDSEKLSFIGGTSLRILRDLDRFSEDLDFDNLGLSYSEIKDLFEKVILDLKREKFKLDFSLKKTNSSGIGSIKFLDLLFILKISSDKKEKLNIKINYTTPKILPETETVVLKRFGFLQPVISNTKSYLLSQKIRAALTRRDFQPRDFYDIVWLLSYRIKPHSKLFEELKVKNEKELFKKLLKFYKDKLEPNLKDYKLKLKPFLLNEEKVSYLDIFGKVIQELI